MAGISTTAAAFLIMSQSFAPITSASNTTVLTNNSTPIETIEHATSDEVTEQMAEYIEIIENDAAIKAIFESDNVVAKTSLVESLKQTIEQKDEYKVQKAKEEARKKAEEEAKRKAKIEAERKKALEEQKKLSSGNFTQMSLCSSNSTKSYMDYRKITNRASAQYQLIHNSGKIHVGDDGLLYSDDGFIGVALGSYFGEIGDKFKFVLSNGQELNVIKIDEKADQHTINRCYHAVDGSVIEFVVHKEKAHAKFGGANGHPGGGNFNNIPQFSGSIKAVYKYNK